MTIRPISPPTGSEAQSLCGPNSIQTHEKSLNPAGGAENNTGVRFGAVVPFAAAATVLLMVSMASLISTEFSPQDQVATPSFDINPVPEEVKPLIDIAEPDALKQVEVPPPPPTVAVAETDAVELPFIEVVGKTLDWDPKSLDPEMGERGPVSIDKDPTPIVRVPPVFPSRFSQGNHSGYCRVSFDISADGKPLNVQVVQCTSSQLKGPSVKSVLKWNYTPKILGGRPVSRAGLETTIKFQLRDERGNILPLPNMA